ncbi:MAG: hypothetical protein AAF289_01665 [Cyanobacteria bacterium P01_A01_bin.135]
MAINPELLAIDRVTAAVGSGSAPFPVRLWDYGGGSLAETVLVIHGRQAIPPDRSRDLNQLYPRLARLATQFARQGKRVLFLDWGEAAAASLPPFGAAERIKPVADWAAEQMQALDLGALSVVGHSLGSYVASQIVQRVSRAEAAPSDLELVALDPAFPAQRYDLDGLTEGRQPVVDFDVAQRSLAFVAQDDVFQTGLAGDNDQAATAQTSFVVDLAGLRGVGDAAAAHGAVIDVYRDFERYLSPRRAATAWVLAQFPRDRVSNRGGNGGDHEGVAKAARLDDVWQISTVQGDGVQLHAVDQISEAAVGAAGQVDIVASLIGLNLGDNVEHLVLGGSADLSGSGNGSANRLYGNGGGNRLVGRGGADTLYGAAGDDDLLGNQGQDLLVGQQGADWLRGQSDDDILMGGGGADQLWGGAGRDRLAGGDGRDQLWGGGGQDWFVLDSGGFDIVQDFQDGRDWFVLPVGIEPGLIDAIGVGELTLLALEGRAIALVNGVAPEQIDAADFTSPDAAAGLG